MNTSDLLHMNTEVPHTWTHCQPYKAIWANQDFSRKGYLHSKGKHCLDFLKNNIKTRMHSSRMHTTHSSSRLPQCMLGYNPPGPGPPGVALETPPSVGLETPPPDPSTSPPGCGPGDPPTRPLNISPWVWAWRPPQARPLNTPGYGSCVSLLRETRQRK